jgi:hypothetical protein
LHHRKGWSLPVEVNRHYYSCVLGTRVTFGSALWGGLRRYWPILVFCGLSLTELVYFSFRGKGYDFAVFYEASKLTLNLGSPWNAVFDPIYAAYLNGPFTAMLISPLGFFSERAALFFARGLTIMIVPFLVFHFIKSISPFQELNILDKKLWLSSCLIILTFPIRANLEYGQFFIIFLTLSVLAFRLSHSSNTRNLLMSGFLLGICCDYKPQCFVVFALLIVFTNKYIFLGGVLSLVVGGLISVVLTRKLPYEVWVDVILKRSEGLSYGDQMHIFALFPGVVASMVTVVFVALLVSIQFYKKSQFRSSQNKILILFVFILITPWMHPTDLALIGVVVVTVSIWGKSLGALNAFGLGCLLVWSSNVWISLILATAALMLLILFFEDKGKYSPLNAFLVISPSVFFAFLSTWDADLEQSHRQYWGVTSIIVATIITGISVINSNEKTLSSQN